MTLDELYNIKGRRFTPDEIKFLKSKLPKKKWLVKYCIWKQKRINGLYILFIIDHFPNKIRKTAMDNSIEVISTRMLSDYEYNEVIENYGCNKRVYQCFDYATIESLIHEDKKCQAITPTEFINECRKRGFVKQADLFGSNYDLFE